MSRGRRYGLVVATDRLPAADPDDSRDHVDAALAALRPLVANRSGAWAPAGGEGSGDGVLGVRSPARAGAAALGASLLRSLCHHQPMDFPSGWFDSYLAVNRRVAAAVTASASASATVWTHGHQLQLLPRLLRRMRPDLAVVMHLHSTFPPAESFARLPEHRALLSGLLGADVIALPHQRAVDNLLDLAERVHGLPVRQGRITLGHRGVRVIAYPLPADTGGAGRLARLPVVRAAGGRIRDAMRVTGTVLLSVAGWDPADAVEQRLHAFERFLAEHRPAPGEVALLHVACGDPRTPAEDAQRQRVDRLIAKINGTHANVGQAVVHYVRAEPDRRDLAALYLACEGMLVTPTHHGTVTTAHEFIAARGDLGATVVVSELTSRAAELPGAIAVNPHDPGAFADAIAQATGRFGPAPRAHTAAAATALDGWAEHLLTTARPPGSLVPVVLERRARPLSGGARARHTRPGGYEVGGPPLAARRVVGR
ncbi:trehalose-6-phosphate synthase [Catellatospora methionotrophica]|uniref:trehalose-6-phosphate synthase n=1 Tax=Catellatospora methionotrophica TaxID=121620 RepID=UPI0033D2819D